MVEGPEKFHVQFVSWSATSRLKLVEPGAKIVQVPVVDPVAARQVDRRLHQITHHAPQFLNRLLLLGQDLVPTPDLHGDHNHARDD